MENPYVYPNAELVRILDGDTVELKLRVERTIEVDFGFHVLQTTKVSTTVQLKFRLLGINTPEVIGEHRAEGDKATAGLKALLSTGRALRATTAKPDKYGRWLAKLEVLNPDGVTWQDVNAAMVAGGFAKPYFGEGPKP